MLVVRRRGTPGRPAPRARTGSRPWSGSDQAMSPVCGTQRRPGGDRSPRTPDPCQAPESPAPRPWCAPPTTRPSFAHRPWTPPSLHPNTTPIAEHRARWSPATPRRRSTSTSPEVCFKHSNPPSAPGTNKWPSSASGVARSLPPAHDASFTCRPSSAAPRLRRPGSRRRRISCRPRGWRRCANPRSTDHASWPSLSRTANDAAGVVAAEHPVVVHRRRGADARARVVVPLHFAVGRRRTGGRRDNRRRRARAPARRRRDPVGVVLRPHDGEIRAFAGSSASARATCLRVHHFAPTRPDSSVARVGRRWIR